MRLRVDPLLTLCAVLALAAGGARAQPVDGAGQRGQIEAEMQRLEQAFAAERAACAARFAVTDCNDEVSGRRRDALAPLRARLLALDEAERRERARARRAAIEAKQAEQRSSIPDPPPPRPAAASAAPGGVPTPLIVVRRDDAAARERAASAAAAERAAASRKRQQQADEAAARVRERIAQREREGKAAAPLPVPTGR